MGRNNIKKISFDKLNSILFINILILVGLYILVQVIITSSVGTKSEEIFNIRNQKSELRLENEILTSKIDAAKSLENSKDFAQKLNLESKQVTFLEQSSPSDLALNQ